MTDLNKDLGGSIWSEEDLDDIRALLDEDGPAPEQTAAWNTSEAMEPETAAPVMYQDYPDYGDYQEGYDRGMPSLPREEKPPRAGVVFLSILIALELAAIGFVAGSWYLWMK